MNIQLRSILVLAAFLVPSSPIYALTPPDSTGLSLVQGITVTDDLTPPGAEELANSRSIAQKITVRVKSANNGGSGVLVAHKGNTYLVLTNQHVTRGANQFQIKTADGTQHTAKFVPKFKSSYDLSLLQFNSDRSYQIADLSHANLLQNQQRIYSAGFPFNSEQIRTSAGTLTKLSDVPMQDGTQIGYVINENEKGVRQGMSGGPILDGRGKVVGINTISIAPLSPNYTYFDGIKPTAKLAARYRQANWGVPIYNFLTQLDPNILYGYDSFPKVQRQVTPTGYMAKLNRETRQQTVRIEDSVGINGSGVIVAQQGNTYYVLTAKHVVENQKKRHAGVNLIAYDQTSYEIEPSNITVATGVDLAIVKFTSMTKYPVAKIGNYIPRGKSTFVFVAGYPGREKIDSPLWQWQLNPGLIVNREWGKFYAPDKLSFSNGYDSIYSSISYGGMSGGPVFDTDGRVIAIHGQFEGEGSDVGKDLIVGQSLGISIQTFLGLSSQLQVPNLLNVSTDSAIDLNNTDRSTVLGTLINNFDPPQAESNAQQWIQSGNQLYRMGKFAASATAFDRAIAKGENLLGNYGKARALDEGGNYKQALVAINQAIAVVPKAKENTYYYVWKYQGVLYEKLGNYKEALISLDKAITLSDSSDSIVLNEKASILAINKQLQKAIDLYDLIIEKQPEAYAYYNRGLLKYRLGNQQAAINDYDLAIQTNPNYADAYLNRGVAKSKLGNNQAEIDDYNTAIKIDPFHAPAYYNRGLLKYRAGNRRAAIRDYDLAIKIDPNYGEAYINRGLAKSDLGNQQEAINDFDIGIKLNPDQPKAYNNRGRAKYSLGNKQAAIEDYNIAIRIDPNYANAYYNRGMAKSDLGNQQAAIDDYSIAIKLDRNLYLAYNNRGNAKSDLGNKQGAIDDYNTAIKINPNYADAYTNRGLAKSNLGNQQAAIDDFNIAIKTNPKALQAYINRGWSNFLSNHNQGAIADWEKSISIEPTSGAYCNLGLYKVILGNNAGGLVDLEKAIKLDSKLADNFVVRGFIRGATGDKEGMLSDYKQALKLNPKIIDEWARDAKQLEKHKNIAAYQKYRQILSGLTSR